MKKLLSLFIAARLYLLAAPYIIFLTGATMNQAVLIANGGKFPVMANERAADRLGLGEKPDLLHVRMTGDTKLNWLGDLITLNGFFSIAVMSPGDLLIMLSEYVGEFSAVVWATLVIGDVARFKKLPVT